MVILVIFERITFHIPKFTAPSRAKECMCAKVRTHSGTNTGADKETMAHGGEGSDFFPWSTYMHIYLSISLIKQITLKCTLPW